MYINYSIDTRNYLIPSLFLERSTLLDLMRESVSEKSDQFRGWTIKTKTEKFSGGTPF